MGIADRNLSAAFRALHAPGRLLLLANAWDAGSARLLQECGAPAIATTSAGVAWSHGYADGNALPPATVAAAIAEVTRVVRVPVSADVEGGYSDDPSRVGELVAAVVGAGAVGINLEDGNGTVDLLCAKIEAAKSAAARQGVDLFLNARVDVYLRNLVPRERALEETLARVRRYAQAGCDGIFVPRLTAPADVRAVVAAVEPLPLNLLAVPDLAPAAELRTLGVRRLSAGSALASAALGMTKRLGTAFLTDGHSPELFLEGIEHGAMNKLLM